MLDTVPGVATPYGMVYETEEPIVDFFDGVHLPLFLDRDFVFGIRLSKEEANEFLALPADKGEIDKALKRLGAEKPDDYKIVFDFEEAETDNSIGEIVNSDDSPDVYDLNRLAQSISSMSDEDYSKLVAVTDYMQIRATVEGVKDLAKISEELDCFTFAPGVSDVYELGAWLIKESGKFEYDPDLEDYYNYRGFGADTMQYEHGYFVEKGYVGNAYGVRFDELLGHNSGMGGMA